MEGILFDENGRNENITLDGFNNNDFFGVNSQSGVQENDLFLDMSSSPLVSSPYLEDGINSGSSDYSLDNLLDVPMFDQSGYCSVSIDTINLGLPQMEMGSLQEILSQGGSAPGSGNQSPIREDCDLTSDDVINLEEEEEDKPKKRGRKRQKRDAANENMDVSQVTVTRDNLLKITSEEYDKMIKTVSDKRAITWAESKHIKTQRRLIKNRESAQASRQRKKEHTDTLSKENEVLRLENEALKKENKSLKDEVLKLSNIIKKTTMSMPSKNTRVAAFAIIFSFGLLFFGMASKNPTGSSVRLHSGINPGQRNLLQFDQVTNDSQERVVSVPSDSQLSSLAQLDSKPSNSNSNSQKVNLKPKTLVSVDPTLRNQHQQKIQNLSSQNNINVENSGKNHAGIGQRVSIPISESGPRDKFIENTFAPSTTGNEFTTARMEEFSNESNGENSNFTKNLVINNESLTKFFDEEVIKYRRNTAYFTCSDFQQLTPLQNEAFDPNAPFYVSFIVPSSAMPNSNFANAPMTDISNGVVEINCQVIDVNIGQISAPIAMVS